MAEAAARAERKGQKRKLADTGLAAATLAAACSPPADLGDSADAEAARLTKTLVAAHDALLAPDADFAELRATLRRACHGLAELAKCEEQIDSVVEAGAVEAIVPLLSLSGTLQERLGDAGAAEAVASWNDDVEKEACFAIGLLANKQEHQRRVADAGALSGLVTLLKRGPPLKPSGGSGSTSGGGVARRAADSITNLAHENVRIKSRVRMEGGIPPLVALLESHDTKVQRAAAGALRTLAFKNEENKNQIVECGALPMLVYMVRSDDVSIHYEAVGVIGNLVHSSHHIKKRVLDEGALQPVIGLLSSRCTESQREAALLLGQFATTDPDYKVKIVQRGAVQPLIDMLSNSDPQLREMAAFALGRLAQNSDNQAGICHQGGLQPLLDLLDARNGSLQHNAAFALYGLADSEDNVAEIVQQGGVKRLMDGDLTLQASKDCVQKTLKRLEEKVQGRVLQYLVYLMRMSDKVAQTRIAVALAHLSSEDDQYMIFVERNGLEVLLEMLTSRVAGAQKDAAHALFTLAKKAQALTPLDVAPPPPTPQVYLGEQYVNNSTLSDVVFIVEGRRFYAHRIALLASSEAFRAMFDGDYKERNPGSEVQIPNIRFDVFEAMMHCIYTGSVEVMPALAFDLLRAADQYLLDGLKRLCESTIAKDLSVESVLNSWEHAETYNASQLKQACIVYMLEHQQKLVAQHGQTAFQGLIVRMRSQIEAYMRDALRRPAEAQQAEVMQRCAAS